MQFFQFTVFPSFPIYGVEPIQLNQLTGSASLNGETSLIASNKQNTKPA